LTTVRWTVVTGVAFPQKSESIPAHQNNGYRNCGVRYFFEMLKPIAKRWYNSVGVITE